MIIPVEGRFFSPVHPHVGEPAAAGQGLHVVLEGLAIARRVLVHAHRQQYVDLQTQFTRIQQRDLAVDHTRLLDLPNPAPHRGARLAGKFGQVLLAEGGVFLHGVEQAADLVAGQDHGEAAGLLGAGDLVEVVEVDVAAITIMVLLGLTSLLAPLMGLQQGLVDNRHLFDGFFPAF